ncbi:hypothetical protein LY474_04550 [Myxococcus stipitatus]|uniref:hypothetical protein n=1 Tax=Myxococcus stipitatus TaxID=83455 RepID=UPI001F35F694|nr:hypothetical protein [Myxococcus stipitatus]MCE9667078.1 hypothetical protein [Myxococcus stipitatus]
MIQQKESVEVQNNFNLKNVSVELVPASERRTATAFIAVADLEAMRTQRRAIPASKHGLETICGASCDTGAQ